MIPQKPKTRPRRGVWQRHSLAERDRLYAQDQHCHWCRRVTLHPHMDGYEKDALATVDHVKSFPESESLREWAHPDNLVLACRGCNQRRGKEWSIKAQSPRRWALYLSRLPEGQKPLVSP